MRCDPLSFPPGEGPFRGRGLIFKGYFRYIEARYPGGMLGLRGDLDDRQQAAFLGRIFLAMSFYDLGPLLHAIRLVARVEGASLAKFICARAEASARVDVPGVYAPLLKAGSIEAMATSLPRVFSRYFEDVQSELLRFTEGPPRVLEIRFRHLPEPILGWYIWSNQGFVGECLALAGARPSVIEVGRVEDDGERDGIALRMVVMRARWFGKN
ncbi:MAG TPA: hypothetical protein ENK31_05485 [Nannocystis exedens]|nr:hypothetical protein [Nannocystis exedens]